MSVAGLNEGKLRVDDSISRHQSKDTGKIVCQVLHALVNTRDGQASVDEHDFRQKLHAGLAFSGSEGSRRVFGLARYGTSTNSIIADDHYVWTIPEGWTFEEAATVPFAYALVRWRSSVTNSLAKYSRAILV